MSKAYLITGGHGFIGKHLARALLARGDEVVVLDNLSSITDEPLPEGCKLIKGDVRDPAAVSDAMQGVAGCFHLAAIASVEQCANDWIGSHQVNVGGAVNVFSAARDHGGIPVVYASSAAVYGAVKTVPVSEADEINPISGYGVDKYSSELHGKIATDMFGVPTVGLRLFNVFGPGQNAGSPYSGVITLFADRLRSGGAITVNGDGKQSRDFIFVGDIVRFFVASMDISERADVPKAHVFNAATGKSTSLLELLQTMQDLFGSPSELTFGPPRAGDIRHSLGDATKGEAALGISAETSLHEGLTALRDAIMPEGPRVVPMTAAE